MIALNLQVDLREVNFERFRDMRRRAMDMRPAMAGPVDSIISSFMGLQFSTEGVAGNGQKWAALKPNTLKYRKRPGHGKGGIGHDTGRLWESLVKTPAAEAIITATSDTYSRRTTVPYAKYFDGGSRGGIQPPRPLFPATLPQWLADQLEAVITNYIVDGTLSDRGTTPVRGVSVSVT